MEILFFNLIILGFLAWLLFRTAKHFLQRPPANASSINADVDQVLEIFWCCIAPIVGCINVYAFKEDAKPFDLKTFPVLMALIAFYMLCYWISRTFKNRSSAEGFVVLAIGLVVGFFINTLLTIHFLSPVTLVGLIICPYFAFPLLAPYIMTFYQWMEIKQLLKCQHERFQQVEKTPKTTWTESQLRQVAFHRNPIFYFLAGLLLLILTSSFWAIGYPMDSLVSTFIDGKEFLFSYF